jgi:quinohemoprotein ethanol dehydrogenase
MKQFILAGALALTAAAPQTSVNTARLLHADADTENWLSHGRTHDEQRFSPLTAINETNVQELGLAWFADLDTNRGQEATPIEVDGTLYVATAWNKVFAYDATTGARKWSYDPKVPRSILSKICCDAVSRGVAVYEGKIYLATLDGRLIALNQSSGKPVWSIRTFPTTSNFTISGAPRIVKGKVLIGTAGAEYVARGFISAYDTQSGKMVWRFYTVPGNPAKPFEQPALKMAAQTWGGHWWTYGGGGTVWDSISYDPKLNLVYFGTGNAAPWNGSIRAKEEGDTLFTSSIVAVNADTGKYVWHFQETPKDRWDFDSAQHIILANIKLNGAERRVVMHAPKNGFFYVLDAATGKFLSGKPFTQVNWAKGLDPVTGRPDYTPEAFYDKTRTPFVSVPGAIGAHSWQPMSYSPKTGLVYIPVNEAGFPYAAADPKTWKPLAVGFNTGIDAGAVSMPALPAVRQAFAGATTGALVAWNPVAQKAAWKVPYIGPWNGGTLATAGNLVFQGTAGSNFLAYNAATGKQLWSAATQTGIIAAPITYKVRGEQYVAVMAGWGGVWDVAAGVLADKSGVTRNISRFLVYKLGAKASLPPAPALAQIALDPPLVTGTPAQIQEGKMLYAPNCGNCHGDAAIAGGLNPDLRHSSTIRSEAVFKAIVYGGALKANGMASYAKDYTPKQVESIRHYLISRANEDKALGMK